MPTLLKEDNSGQNWRLILDEIKSLKDKLDNLTHGQRQIQESLATKANGVNGHRSADMPVPPDVAGNEDGPGLVTVADARRHQGMVTLSKKPLPSCGDEPTVSQRQQANTQKSSASLATATSAITTHSSQVNHFASMAEKELKFVFQENTGARKMKRELSEYVQKKCQRISENHKGVLSEQVGNSRYVKRLMKTLHLATAEKIELIFDSVVGLIIFMNAVFVGVSMDQPDADKGIFLILDIMFGVTFWGELLLKLRVHGCKKRYCCGIKERDPDDKSINMKPRRVSCGESFSNVFDLSLVIIDTAQLIITLGFPAIAKSMEESGNVSASLFRVVRLMRLARILRLLRAKVFKDLLSMIQGMMGGLGTLGWSLVLFVIFIYVVALVFRELVGLPPGTTPDETKDADIRIKPEWYFRNVPRSMFTVFRCSFGDCSTSGGTPIFEGVIEDNKNGSWLSLVYSGFVFVVMIGLFNVISAIFVESTMTSAAELQADKQRKRLENPQRWAINFIQLLSSLLGAAWPDDDEYLDSVSQGMFTDELWERLQTEEFDRKLFDEVLETDGKAQEALQELDIQKADHRYLSDILDPDNSGTIGVFELIDGLQRLRGDPRRSDIIAVDLMVRAIQMKIDDLWRWKAEELGLVAPKGSADGIGPTVDSTGDFDL